MSLETANWHLRGGIIRNKHITVRVCRHTVIISILDHRLFGIYPRLHRAVAPDESKCGGQ